MADNQKPEELVFHIPAKDFKYTHGCSMDFGGSVIKIAYTVSEAEQLSIHCASFPANQLEGALQYLKLHAPKALKLDSTINICGVGCHRHKELIKKTLGVEIAILNEFDGFVLAFRYLFDVLPREKLFYPESKVVSEHVNRQLEAIQNAFADMGNFDTGMAANVIVEEEKQDKKVTSRDEKIVLEYPALLVMCGSGSCAMSIKEDGTYEVLDGILACGRYFLGMGSLLTSAKTFNEIVTLAENGDSEKLDVVGKALKEEGAGDIYSAMMDDEQLYGMGHAVGKNLSDFRREDLAAALVNNVSFTVAQYSHLWVLLQNVKNVYFCGSLVANSQVFRDAIGKHIGVREKMNALEKQTEHYFLRSGAYLGCIGCMMMTLKQETVMSTSL